VSAPCGASIPAARQGGPACMRGWRRRGAGPIDQGAQQQQGGKPSCGKSPVAKLDRLPLRRCASGHGAQQQRGARSSVASWAEFAKLGPVTNPAGDSDCGAGHGGRDTLLPGPCASPGAGNCVTPRFRSGSALRRPRSAVPDHPSSPPTPPLFPPLKPFPKCTCHHQG